jgi:formylglycine-generating enzyme required for sulfatase activity
VIARALSEDRNDRYPSIGDFGQALSQALAVPARRRARPWLVATGALLAACGLFALFPAKRHPPGALKMAPATAPGVRDPALAGIQRLLPAAVAPPAPRAPRVPQVRGATVPGDLTDPVARPARKDTDGPGHREMVNSLGMILVLIPPGDFPMGSPTSLSRAWDNEKPQHLERIEQPFYLGTCEVTVGQFRAFVSATGFRTTAECDGKGGAVFDSERKGFVNRPELTWCSPGLPQPQGDDEPVVQVCRGDAQAFCDWLSQREGVEYRLPTEAEWEYACRAGGGETTWYFGDDPEPLPAHAWFVVNSRLSTHRVGLKAANAFGLHDMYGNVWEWCGDCHDPDPLGDSPGAPGAEPRHVLRGGSFGSKEPDIRSARRRKESPDSRFSSCGFRVRRACTTADAGLRSP